MSIKEFWLKCRISNIYIKDVTDSTDGYLVTFKNIYAAGVSGEFLTKKYVAKSYEELLELIKEEHPYEGKL